MSSGKRILICKHCGGRLLDVKSKFNVKSKFTKNFRHIDGTSFGIQYCENVDKTRDFYTYEGPTAEPLQEEDIVDRVMKKYYDM